MLSPPGRRNGLQRLVFDAGRNNIVGLCDVLRIGGCTLDQHSDEIADHPHSDPIRVGNSMLLTESETGSQTTIFHSQNVAWVHSLGDDQLSSVQLQ